MYLAGVCSGARRACATLEASLSSVGAGGAAPCWNRGRGRSATTWLTGLFWQPWAWPTFWAVLRSGARPAGRPSDGAGWEISGCRGCRGLAQSKTVNKRAGMMGNAGRAGGRGGQGRGKGEVREGIPIRRGRPREARQEPDRRPADGRPNQRPFHVCPLEGRAGKPCRSGLGTGQSGGGRMQLGAWDELCLAAASSGFAGGWRTVAGAS